MSPSDYSQFGAQVADQKVRAFAANIAVLILDFLLTTPSVLAIYSHFRRKKTKPRLYEDKDGVASEQSMAAYSAKLPKIVLAIFTIAGFAIATSLAVITTLNRNENSTFGQNWLNVAQWVLNTIDKRNSCSMLMLVNLDCRPSSDGFNQHCPGSLENLLTWNIQYTFKLFLVCSPFLPDFTADTK